MEFEGLRRLGNEFEYRDESVLFWWLVLPWVRPIVTLMANKVLFIK